MEGFQDMGLKIFFFFFSLLAYRIDLWRGGIKVSREERPSEILLPSAHLQLVHTAFQNCSISINY